MKTLAIAAVTLRETLRRKVQVNLLIFGTVLVLASYFVSSLTLGEMHRMISDLALSGMELIGILLAVFLGASVVAGDIERRVIYPVVAKPVTRSEYLVGRYLGLAAALVLNLAVMVACLGAVLAFDARSLRVLDTAFWAACAGIGVQLLVVGAVAVFFSSITTTTLAAIFTLSIAVAGRLSNEMVLLWKGDGAWVAKALWYALPNLGGLSFNEAVIYHRELPPSAWLAALYGLLYASTAVAAACLAFDRRDFK